MKRKMKVVLSCALIVMFIFTILAGCSKKEEPSTSTPTSKSDTTPTSEAATTTQSEQPIEYTIMFPEHPSMPTKDTWLFPKELEAKTNIKLKLMPIPMSAWNDKVNITIASGTLPDIMNMVDLAILNDYGSKGLFLNIMNYKQVMPNIEKTFDSVPFLKSYMLSNKELYGMPSYITSEKMVDSVVGLIPMIRKDIFKKNNLNVPTTYDELHQSLKKLKELYPQSSPWVTRQSIDSIISALAPSWGINTDLPMVEFDPGSKKYSSALKDAKLKNFIEYMATLYKEGLLDKEYAITPTKQWEEKIISGKGFFTVDYFARPDMMTSTAQDAGNSEFDLSAILPPTANDGISKVYANVSAGSFTGISANVKEPERLMKLYDYWFFSEEGSLLGYYGVNGVSYTLDGKTIKAKYESDTKSFLDINAKYGTSYYGFMGLTPDRFGYDFDDPNMSAKYKETWDMYKDATTEMLPILNFNKDEMEVKKVANTTLQDYIKAELNKFVMGQRSLAEWDAFVSSCDQKGMTDLVKIMNDAQARLDANK